MKIQIKTSVQALALGALTLTLFAGCESVKTRSEISKSQTPMNQRPPVYQADNVPPTTQTLPTNETLPELTPSEAPSLPVMASRPRLALILGPGGLRAYAHAGVLQEIAKAKIQVYWIGGLEMGALPAALFAMKGQPFEAEWQMMKLKEDDLVKSGLLGGAQPLRGESLSEPLKSMFAGNRAEDSKISFTCPSLSLAKKQTFMMNRGPFAQMLLYCLPAPPLMTSYQGTAANPTALGLLAQSARQKGAQLLVYIDLLSENPINETAGSEGYAWGVFQQDLEFQSRQVSEVFKVGGLGGLKSFDQRREMLQKGQEAGKRLVQLLQSKYAY